MSDDPAEAWIQVRKGEAALARYRQAVLAQAWAQRVSPPPADHRYPPVVDTLPPHLLARGLWLALGLALRPDEVWLRLPHPDSVVWPEGIESLLARAVPESGQRFTALRGEGFHSSDR